MFPYPISYLNSSNKQFSYDSELNSTGTCLVLNPTENLTNFLNKFRHCKYYYIDEIESLNTLNDKNSLSFFHINACFVSEI